MNTSQHSELDRIKLKIKALAAKTVSNGATEAEALAAMNVVGRLLLQYDLTMNELDVRDATFRTIYMEIGRERRHPIDHCVTSIAAFTSTKTWFHKRWNRASAYAFFGQEQDLQMAEYLFNLILSAINAEVKAFKHTDTYRDAYSKKSAYVSFQRGMATRLALRLREMKSENDATLKANSTSTALVVLKDQLTNDAFNKEGIRLRTVKTTSRANDPGAYMAGNAAGGRVNLSRPLDQGNAAQGLITGGE